MLFWSNFYSKRESLASKLEPFLAVKIDHRRKRNSIMHMKPLAAGRRHWTYHTRGCMKSKGSQAIATT
jgi:hypothetical protein